MNGVPATLVYTVAVSPSTLAWNDELAGRGDPDIVGLLLDTVVDGFWVAVDPAVGLTYDEVWSAGTVSVWTLYDCPVVEFTAVIAFFIVDSNCDPIPGNLETISLWSSEPDPLILKKSIPFFEVGMIENAAPPARDDAATLKIDDATKELPMIENRALANTSLVVSL